MKLLPKNEIQKLKAVAQKQAIDEGVKLAKRVDNLREVAASEEASLEQFRQKTLIEIQHSIQKLSADKDTLLMEVKDLEERKLSALQPLDVEKQRLVTYEAELTAKAEAIQKQIDELSQLATTTREAVANAENRIAHITTLENTLNARAVDTDNAYKESIRVITEARLNKAQTERELALKQSALDNRELSCVNRENNIILKEKELDKERTALLHERIRLEDRARTLERAFNRLKK